MTASCNIGAATASDIPLSGLVLWLRSDTATFQDTARTSAATADGHEVQGWADQSGSDNHVSLLSVAAPVLATVSGKKVVRFDRNSFSIASTIEMTACDGFIVYKNNESTSGVIPFCYNTGAGSMLYHSTSEDQWKSWPFDSLGAANAATIAATAAADTTLYIYGWRLDAAGTTAYINNGAGTTTASVNSYFRFNRMGQYGGITTYNPKGDMYEVILYNRKLSTDDKNAVLSYLNAEYGVY